MNLVFNNISSTSTIFLNSNLFGIFMPQNNFPKELSDLIGRIESLNFVTDKEVASVNPKCNRNSNNALNFNNNPEFILRM